MQAEIIVPTTAVDWQRVAVGYAASVGCPVEAAQTRVTRLRERPEGVAAVAAVGRDGDVIAHVSARLLGAFASFGPTRVGALDMTFVRPEHRDRDDSSLALALFREFGRRWESAGTPVAALAYFEDCDWWNLRRSSGFEAVATGMLFVRGARAAGGSRRSGDGLEVAVATERPGVSIPRTCRCVAPAARALPESSRAVRHRVFQDGALAGEAVTRDHGDHAFIVDWRCDSPDPAHGDRLLDLVTDAGRRPAHFLVWHPTGPLLAFLSRAGFATTQAGPEPILAMRSRLPSHLRSRLLAGRYVTSALAGEQPVPRLFPESRHIDVPYVD